MRLTAPDFVLGGKNSREKNLSLLSHLDCNTQVDILEILARNSLDRNSGLLDILELEIPPGIDLLCQGGSKTVHLDRGRRSGAEWKGIESRRRKNGEKPSQLFVETYVS